MPRMRARGRAVPLSTPWVPLTQKRSAEVEKGRLPPRTVQDANEVASSVRRQNRMAAQLSTLTSRRSSASLPIVRNFT